MIQDKRFDAVEGVRSVGETLRAEITFKLPQQSVPLLFACDFYCHAAGLVVEVDGSVHTDQVDYDRERDEILYGRVPAGAVVVPGTLPAKNGKYGLSCAVIVKRVDAQTRAKTSLNELLRNFE